MSQRHLAVPEDDLKPYCKNALEAKLQYPPRQTRGRPEAALSKNATATKLLTPESSASAVPMASTEDRSDTREDARS